ncbi:alkane 1-monooxygenase [Ramlibacter albus]|uniref:Alkane 1-monooxygenase n=1 Tax=Ramlibacter albus TaxID=2079448 RepID=A0A923S1M8_9BURK|nr:alkane 1-monooxygenase [Ramlibacter albus]MBC5764451.1 alkane 1-monooxygenase [Ramlibacter albus]
MHAAGWHWLDARFALGCALPALSLFNVLVRPGHAAMGAFLIFAFIAIAEAVWPGFKRSPEPVGEQHGLVWLLRLYVPLQLALLAAAVPAAARADWGVVFGLAFAVGFVTGAQGITYAHELGHSRSKGDRVLGWVLMTTVNYPQFMVEHYRGHHVRAATPADPATARLGESLWRFLPRTVAGNFMGAWRLEAVRLAQFRRGWASSPMVWATSAQIVLLAIVAAVGGWKAVVFWFAQSAFAVWLLETVNYIEHYGLVRAPGEPFGPQHAWNADHAISNSLLANLQRHSDHHMHAWKAYPALQALPDTPQLPTGYAGCIVLAAIPPLWFRLVHPATGARAGSPLRADPP